MLRSRFNDLFTFFDDFYGFETICFLMNAVTYDRATFLAYTFTNFIDTANIFLVVIDEVSHVYIEFSQLTLNFFFVLDSFLLL